jgi:transcription initiation factor IIE alpha subunit
LLKLAAETADTPAEANMNQNPDSNSIRRIILPSGRALEVLKFHLQQTSPRGLHVCSHCDSRLVQPMEWREEQPKVWELTLECPNCLSVTEGLYSQREVDQLEEELDEGLAEMLNDLRRLTQANMAEEIARFAEALRADFILPEDF